MKKLFLLFLAVMSLNAMEMEDDNNNNNNNNDTNKALIETKNTDWIPGAARLIVHQHSKKRNWRGKDTFRRCWRHYPVGCCEKVKANKCPDFGNPEVEQAYLVAVFYDKDKKIMSEQTLTQQKSKNKKAKEELFQMAKKKLDLNVKPQAVRGVLLTSLPPMSVQLYDKDGLQIFYWEGLIHTQLPLKPKKKEEISQWVDLTNMPDSALITDLEEYEAEKRAKKEKKALTKALKKEKK